MAIALSTKLAWLQPRFSLRALFVLVSILAFCLGWYGNWRAGKIREHDVERRLVELGGDTGLSYSYDIIEEYGNRKPSWLDLTLPERYRSSVYCYTSARRNEDGSVVESSLNDEVCRLISQLPNLRVLKLGPRAEHDFTKLRGLPQLEYLTLLCEATDADLAPFLNQRRLKELYLWGQPITNQGLLLAAHNPDLRAIELDNTLISDEGLRHLSKLKKLEVLSLCGTKITSAGIKHLAALERLEILDLERTLVDDSAIPELTKFPLRYLNVNETRISAKGREALYRTIDANYDERMRSENGD